MTGKKWLIITVTVLILGAVGAGLYFKFNTPKKEVPLVLDTGPTPTSIPELAPWIDQSEFSFQYPKELSLNPHEEDKVNYAHVELTSATHSGSLIAWTKDTTSTTIEDWAKKSKLEGYIDTTLAGLPAKKIISDQTPRKLTTSTIRNGYLYQIEVNLEDVDFWNKVYDTVYSSFKFTSANQGEAGAEQKPAGQSVPQGQGDVVEAEEVIE